MKWFAKYWLLFWEHKKMEARYYELLQAIDKDFWSELDLNE